MTKDTYALLDTRIAAEFWLAGDGETPRKRNAKLRKLYKAGGDYRAMTVALADGSAYRVGTYLSDDRHAATEAVRIARSRAMEAVFRADAARRLDQAQAERERRKEAGADPTYSGPKWYETETAPDPFPFVTVRASGIGEVRTRACEVAEVVSVRTDDGAELWTCEEAPAPAKPKRDPFVRFSDDDLWAELERRDAARRPALALAA